MHELSARSRLLSTFLLLAAALVAKSLPAACAAYGFALLAVIATGTLRQHARFVGLAALPLLAALLVLWGWLMPQAHPAGYSTGPAYALSTWLKIVSCGAVVQALMIPLIDRPAYLHQFLEDTRMPPPLAQVFVTAVIFIPEVGRRLNRLTEARAAQGYPNHLLARVVSLPQLLAPLVSSLIDTALRRAEFWSHRGVLTPRSVKVGRASSPLLSLGALELGFAALATALIL